MHKVVPLSCVLFCGVVSSSAIANPLRPVLSLDAGPTVGLDGRLGAVVAGLGSSETMRVITQRPTDTTVQLTIVRNGEQRTIRVPVRAGN